MICDYLYFSGRIWLGRPQRDCARCNLTLKNDKSRASPASAGSQMVNVEDAFGKRWLT
tara:strand:+ start:756 stop:929 length:174 start_codon:yes stop_codon:yes gene_type:complete